MSTETQRRAWREKSRRQYAALTPEQKAARIARIKAAADRRREADLEGERAKAREKYRRRAAHMTPEQRARRHEREAARYERRRVDPQYWTAKAASDAARTRRPAGTNAAPLPGREHQWARIAEQQEFTKATAMPGYRYWAPEEDREALRTDLTVLEIALSLGRTRWAVVTRRRDLRRAS